MQITVKDDGVNARVQLTGRLDAAGVTAVWVPFNSLVEAKRGLIVDLSGTTFITSNGIRMLVAAAKTLTRRGGRLILVKPNSVVSEVLAVTGMDTVMPVVRSDKEAEGLLAME
jgi:anti-anti-sigma factor